MFSKNNNSQFKLSCCDSSELVNAAHWNTVVGNSNIFITLPYLNAIEQSKPENIEFRYLLFYNNQLKPVAAAYFQIIHFVDEGFKYVEKFCPVKNILKNKLLQSVDIKVLLCGNIFSCGENGFIHTKDIGSEDAFQLLADTMNDFTNDKEKNGQISFSLLKEYWPKSTEAFKYMKANRYKNFMIDVNMVMEIRPEWKVLDDYLLAMTTKYRTKVKGVYKKAELIKVEDFSAIKIEEHITEIENLYNAVTSKATYNFANLNGLAFLNFKKKLDNQFIFKAYFIGEKMVGFSTLFHFQDIADANYVGLNYELNKEYAIYQLMLYDFVEQSIKLGVKELRLGRTAELIKSSIGAAPVDMTLFIKHRNRISNKLLGPFIQYISPSKFELRPPFKKELV